MIEIWTGSRFFLLRLFDALVFLQIFFFKAEKAIGIIILELLFNAVLLPKQ